MATWFVKAWSLSPKEKVLSEVKLFPGVAKTSGRSMG